MDKIDQFKIKNQDLAESFMPGRDKVFGAILGAAKQHAEQKGKRDQLRAMLEPEMAGGGNVVKALARAAKAVDVLPAAERQTNLDKLLQASKVPMRLYHGTTATEGGKGTDAIRAFKPSKEGSLGSGVYLSPNAEFASSYAERSGGNVLPVHVQMENPLVLHGSENPEKYLDPMIEALTRLGMDGPKARKMVERAYDTKGYIGKEVESRARAAGYDGLMQYRNGNLEEVVSYNPSSIKSAIGNVGTFDTTINDLSKKAGGDVHMARGGDIKALINAVRALDLPPAAASQRTQIPGTEPTYRKAKEILDREMPGGRTLDYGSGLGIGSRVLGSESFEPFPREGVAPTYTRAEDIPSDAFHRLVNLNMLNVVPRDVRDAAVENIGRVMRPGGMGLVTTRGKDVMKASGELGPEPNSMITSIGTYQKGFTPEELREYLQYILGNKYDIGRLNLGPAGAVVRKKSMKEGGEVHAANGLPLTFAYDKEDPDAYQKWMRESQFGKVDIPAPYKVTPEEVTVARAMRTPAPEMSAKDKLRTLLQEGVKQGKKEVKTLGDPNAVTDLVNRGLIANNPVSGAIDLVNMGLEPFGLGSEMPIGGSAHVQKLMKDYGFTKQERPLLETGLALASPFAPSAAKKVGQLAKDTAPAAREALRGALESGMESGLIQGPAYAIKPVGGQWLDAPRGNRLGLGNESLAESKTALDRALERVQFGIPEWQELVAAGKFPAHIAEGNINAIRQNLEMAKQSHALNSFTEKQLTNYIRNQMGSPEDPILKLAENWPNERAAMLAERRQRLGALEAKRQAIETNPVPADVRDPAAWRQARIRTIEGEMAGVRESIDNIIEHQPLHMPTSEVGLLTDTATRREKAGFPAHGTATTDIGRGWENLTDRQIKNIEAWKLASSDYLPSLYDADAANLSASIFNKPRPHNLTPQQIQEVRMYRNDPLAQPEFLQENKWLGKLDPGTPIYGLNEPQRVMRALGFDHVMDVLQSDLRSGRIKPEQLNRMSVEDAVRRTAEYNAEKAAAMSKAEATSAANLTPHRDYPGGYRMVQLDKPGQFAKESQLMGHSVEGYEPPPGHPDWVDESLDVGSKLYGATKEGWEGLKSGQTQVFSFRDSKNRPHATLEIKKPGPTYQEMKKIIDGYDMDENAKMDRLFQLGYVDEAGNVLPDKPNEIVQIKGKVNNLVNEDYWPYLQRYVRESGMPVWSDDLNKIGLIDMRGRKLAYTSNPDKVKNIPDYITESERQRLRSAGEFTPDPHFSSPEFASQGMKRGGAITKSPTKGKKR